MSLQTICCILCVPEAIRKILWDWMERYTLLINELLNQIASDEKFSKWQEAGEISKSDAKALLKKLKDEEQFKGLPSRLYTSADTLVRQTYKSWLALQSQRYRRMEGKQRWLNVLEDDLHLDSVTDFDWATIHERASEIREQVLNPPAEKPAKSTRRKKPEKLKPDQKPLDILFKRHAVEEDLLNRRAIAYLIRNCLEITEEEEVLDTLMYRFEKKRIEIERLEKQLESRKPKGRDPVGRRFDEISRTATALPEHTTPDQTEAEFNTWKPQKQIQFFNTLLYPVLFGGSDLTWSIQVNTKEEETIRNQENLTPKRRRSKKKQKKSAMQICVNFKGFEEPLELIPGEFKVQCDRRQLHIIRQIASDFQAHKELPDAEKFSLGLMAIRSAQLLWKKDEQELYKKDRQYNQRKKAKKAERLIKKALLKQLPQPPWKTYKKDKKTEKTQRLSKEQLSKEPLPKKEALPQQPPQPPWKLYRLCLHITIDSQLTTAEGTEIVRQEKIIETNKALAGLKQNYEKQLQEDSKVKETSDDLVKKQNARKSKIKAATTSLIRLQKPTPPRPSKPPYQGQPHILVGVGFSRDRIVGVVVMDMKTKVVLEYQNIRLLLSNRTVKAKRGNRSVTKLRLEQYRLINHRRRQQQQNAARRMQEQKRNRYVQSNNESNLGEYVDRLIASKIAKLATTWKASSIAIPELGDIRESVEAGVKARAKHKFPNQFELQSKYAEKFRSTHHRWSYGRLSEFIKGAASSAGIPVEKGKQPIEGQLQEKAIQVSLSAYYTRKAPSS